MAATMTEWVDATCGRRLDVIEWGAGMVAEQMDTAALFMAHADAVVALARDLAEDDRGAWNDALKAVCEELGQRIDAARFDGQRNA